MSYLAALVRMEIGFDAADHSGADGALKQQTQLAAGITGLGLGGAVSATSALLFGFGLAMRACWRLSLPWSPGSPSSWPPWPSSSS